MNGIIARLLRTAAAALLAYAHEFEEQDRAVGRAQAVAAQRKTHAAPRRIADLDVAHGEAS